MQNWRKLGMIFSTNRKYEWMQTHAMMPVIDVMEKDKVKIYFSARDIKGRSQGASIEVDLNNPFKILKLSREPVLCLGQLGAIVRQMRLLANHDHAALKALLTQRLRAGEASRARSDNHKHALVAALVAVAHAGLAAPLFLQRGLGGGNGERTIGLHRDGKRL